VQHDARLERFEDMIVTPGFMIGHDVGHESNVDGRMRKVETKTASFKCMNEAGNFEEPSILAE
jgi:hypothetical protein